MKLPLHELILTGGLSTALAALIVRLLTSGLARAYKFFFGYVIVEALETVFPFFIKSGNIYGYIYMGFQVLKLVFYALIVFELYSVLLRDLTGIAKIARRFSIGALIIAVLLSALLATAMPHQQNILRRLFYVEIPIISSLVLFMLLIAAFLTYYPVPRHRNVVVYAAGYIVYFFSKIVLLFMVNLGAHGALYRAYVTMLMLVDLGCVITWAILLNKAGEKRTMALGNWRPPDRQQQVLHRLRELDATLLRSGPK